MDTNTRDGLRADRDRFVAFAFCDADILIELNHSQDIVFAAGATMALLGQPPETLIGKDIFELIPSNQHRGLREVVRMAEGGARIEPMMVRLKATDGETPPLALTGFHLPDAGGHYFLALRMGLPSPAPVPTAPTSRDTDSGLFDKESFTEVAKSRLKAIDDSSKDYKYSVFQLGGFSELRARLDEERRIQLLATIGETLRADSLYGDTAGQIDDDRFGLVHGASTKLGTIKSQIEKSSRDADPKKEGVQIRSASVDLDTEGLSDDDALNALTYTINHLGDGGSRSKIRTLSGGLTALVEETAQEMAEARIAVDSDTFEVLYQPIVDLDTMETRHYEVLARFGNRHPARSPSDFFQFVEEVGLIRDLDLACCRRAIRTLKETRSSTRLSVNLSNKSLCHEGFIDSLMALLRENTGLADRLYFDIKESSIVNDQIVAHRMIRELRDAGHKICIDDFGAGASVLHYLRSIEVDMVKIDSKYLADVLALKNGVVFLRSIAGLCDGLGITAIASMVENQSSIKTIRDTGIRYAQGYLFGKPTADIETKEAVAV